MMYMENGVIWCYTHCCEQSIQFHDCMLRKRNVYDRLSEAARGTTTGVIPRTSREGMYFSTVVAGLLIERWECVSYVSVTIN